MNEVVWDGEYKMKDFITCFAPALPILIKTLTGYSGLDLMHEIGRDEMYLIYGIQRQKRYVLKVKNQETYLSIPSDYDDYFETEPGSGPYEKFKLKDYDISKLNKPTKNWIRTHKNKELYFQVGADEGGTASFGYMEIIDTYDEKYLLGYPLCQDQIHSNSCSLPVYVDIELQTAKCFKNFDIPTFNDWVDKIKKIANSYKSPVITMCDAPLLFTELPSDGDYEYINPQQLANNYKIKEALKANNDCVLSQAQSNTYELPYKAKAKVISTDLPKLPRRALPPVPPNTATGAEVKTGPKVLQKNFNPSNNSQRRIPLPPPEIPEKIYNPVSPPISNDDIKSAIQKMKPNSVSHMPSETSHSRKEDKPSAQISPFKHSSNDKLVSATSQPPSSSSTGIEPKNTFRSSDYAKYVAKLNQEIGATNLSFNDVKTIYDLPKQLDLSRLSVKEVRRCLELLHLERYAEEMELRDVDGSMLVELNDEMLTKEFNFSSFDAKKLMKFIWEGWRPSL